MFEYEFGDIVTHKEIGYVGKVRGRVEYSDGSILYGISLRGFEHIFNQGSDYRWIKGKWIKLYKEKK